jgi:hypothetical protein
MSSRRDFLKTSAFLSGSLGLLGRNSAASVFTADSKPSGYFGVHPFVEQHPEAVFIMRTHVDSKTNSEACKQAGLTLGRSLFVPMDDTGIPVNRFIAAKPNLTAHATFDAKKGITPLNTMGIVTDAFFVEGIFESLKELGVAGSKLQIRDANGSGVLGPHRYLEMADQTGATVLPVKGAIKTPEDANDAESFVWKNVPGGVISEQIPYLWPFNAPDAWNLNIAKFKAHEMGLTLTSKNWQGSCAAPFQQYCSNWKGIQYLQKYQDVVKKEFLNPSVFPTVQAAFKRHLQTIPRWNTPDFARIPGSDDQRFYYNNSCMEVWAHRTIDNLSATPVGLHMVEGIYGRDGDFSSGPNPLGNENNFDGQAWDYMTNIVIFGKNNYLVDIIGHWLGGHNPGNFGLFHIAMERGKLNVMNPMTIPVYEWVDGAAVRRPLTGFTRTPLRTFYLQQREKEPLWHLVDEPFDYSTVSETKPNIPAKPTTRVLNQHYPNAYNSQLAIEFSVPKKGPVYVDILDQNGQLIETIFNAVCDPGYHMAAWDTARYGSGTYKYHLVYDYKYTTESELVLNKA